MPLCIRGMPPGDPGAWHLSVACGGSISAVSSPCIGISMHDFWESDVRLGVPCWTAAARDSPPRKKMWRISPFQKDREGPRGTLCPVYEVSCSRRPCFFHHSVPRLHVYRYLPYRFFNGDNPSSRSLSHTLHPQFLFPHCPHNLYPFHPPHHSGGTRMVPLSVPPRSPDGTL